ncbi:hypothetical protein GCM10007852_16740 [Agaribacter marinus]|uniref:Uncharacterized protein n=1 Tax=Agaribacter marinus TaxID=1431249 RepID=A0AA37SZD5_9ALTE|nr:hypothetical protein GCM10007852_16740 [Agaribacter marinus]
MSYKFKHFAQPIKTDIKNFYEMAPLEFSAGVICAGFAYVSYKEIIQLFIACTFVAAVCFVLTIYNILEVFKIRRARLSKENNK